MRELIAVPLAAMEEQFSCIPTRNSRTIAGAQRADAIAKQIFRHWRGSFIHSGKHLKDSTQKNTVQSANSIQCSFSFSN
jgi:hypothetical protein